ncbi:MAG: GntR family transcriptional regulator [Microbacteriaceae bacterium]|nr:GntR family transcriptional regulator [Microbacteriaceae bacterium]
MKSSPAKDTMAIAVRDKMRADILGARLKPGQRLMFAELSERYGVSVGVTREALTWLSSQGLVKATAHQGYMVTPLTMAELDALTEARLLIESEVLKLSIRNGDTEWEGLIIAAHHVLSRTPSSAEGSDPNDDAAQDAWAEAHAAYHEALLSACGNPRLMQIVRTLSEEAALYRRWSISLGHINHQAAAEHRALLEHCLAREPEEAAEALRQHVSHTRQMLMEYITEAQ